jgi:hypothetical protein
VGAIADALDKRVGVYRTDQLPNSRLLFPYKVMEELLVTRGQRRSVAFVRSLMTNWRFPLFEESHTKLTAFRGAQFFQHGIQ